MTDQLHFLIIDGYPEESRDELARAGMALAWKLYADMLLALRPRATFDVLLPSDPGAEMPAEGDLERYAGILWTGCNLSINDVRNPSVSSQIALAKVAYRVGVPSFGSCWGLQMAAVAAGGMVRPNPRGREMGLARKIRQTANAAKHPMFKGKPLVFDGFTSHDDMVTMLPPGGVVLAGNAFTPIQAAEVTCEKGIFWGVQYHPEYTLHEMARLIVAREEKLIEKGFFESADDLADYVTALEALAREPDRGDLRWQLAVDDDVLDDKVRRTEFANWLDRIVLPWAATSK